MARGHTLQGGTIGFIHKQNKPQEKSMNNKSYDRITERIVSLLSQGTVPWHKPWQIATGLPRNLVSQKAYRGINVFLLMAMNYESPHWLTLRQANLLGGQINPGEKSCPVVFWKPMKVKDKESGEDRKIPFLRLYHVFNVSQCTGLKNIPPADDSAFIQTLPAEIVANMPQRPVIKHGMTAAYYSPVNDSIGMPDSNRFETSDHYHATLFHELVHATGHEKRLKQASILERNGYGSEPYGKEELIAELGSAFLCGYAGIVDRTINSSAAYLEGWLKQLKEDKTLIVHAAAQAQKAADFILGHKPENPVENIIPKISDPAKREEVLA
jgi:antirestriction protein ArdC